MANRSFKLTNLSLKNKTTVFILTFLLTIFGLISYQSMPKSLYPDIVMPTIMVQTVYPGNSPADIENLITRPIEKELKSIKGIKKLSSSSLQDNSSIIVEFNTDVELKTALQDVKDGVDKAKGDLPSDLDMDPMVMDIDFSEFPILNINLSGDFSLDELKVYAEYLQDEIETFGEISKVEITGLLDKEVLIEADLHLMESTKVSFRDIEDAVRFENISIAAGDVLIGDLRRTVRTSAEFKSAKEIGNIIVKHEKGNIVYLKDIATVTNGYEDRESFARLYSNPVVSLNVVKKTGQNLLVATDKIMALLAQSKESKQIPKNLSISITNDQSEQTRDQLSNLENSIIFGVILVVLTLLFFLGLRNALFVGLAIPLSMFISFVVFGGMGTTMNMIVLFALILALGMLVDNAIVVIENIDRLFNKEGLSRMEAAKKGVGEIATPIISSTATTLAAFFPLLFWDDLMGEFMGYIPMTLIIVLGSSLFVALVINPVFAATFIKKEERLKPQKKKIQITAIILAGASILFYLIGYKILGSLALVFSLLSLINGFYFTPWSYWFQDVLLVRLEKRYSSILARALNGRQPLKLLFGTFGLLIFSIVFFVLMKPNVEFFPVNEPKYINVFIELPNGTDVNYTDSVAKVVEKKITTILQPYQIAVSSVLTNVGSGTADPNEMGGNMGNTPNKARITINFLEYRFREGVITGDVMKELSSNLRGMPGVDITVDKNRDGPPMGRPINMEISGEDFDQLLSISEDVQKIIDDEKIAGIEGLKVDLELNKAELLVNIDRDMTRRMGVSTSQVGSTIRTALFGKELSKFKDGEDEYPIVLRLADKYRYNVSSLMNQRITFRSQSSGKIMQIPVSAVADYSYNNTYGSVNRKDLKRQVTIYSNVVEGYNESIINEQIKKLLDNYTLPAGYNLQFTGKQQEQAESQAFLSKALMIAIALITIILVSQFNSVFKPVIIIMTVLFSTIGVFLGLAIFNMDFVIIMTGIGIVSLAGIVVNNAIVLIDYIDLLKSRKREELGLEENAPLNSKDAIDCIKKGGEKRLRPVLLTAITTVLGLLPLATGMNINFSKLLTEFNPEIFFGGDNALFWGPMAWTVIFGLTFATFLTLIIVPVMYLLSDKLRNKLKF
ncbi:MAG: efflux RND transporter permease subunit [Flavobacteriales bacterium]|tara:strand:+ start:1037 stop:4420 length:3384 start_codon:yes stop_codon:yes gene_type:complete